MKMPPFVQQVSAPARYAVLAAAISLALLLRPQLGLAAAPGRIGGLVFGTLAGLLFVNAGLYPWRRRWRTRPWGTAERWLHLHVYGSVLAFPARADSRRLSLARGLMGWLLLLLSFWATATGLLGVWIQRTVRA